MGGHHDWPERYHHHHWGMPRIIAATIGGIIVAVVLGFLFGWFVEHLWNWLMPDLFGFKVITYWQGFGLVVLAKLLFGGPAHHPAPHHKYEPWQHSRNWACKGDKSQWAPGGSPKNWKYYEQYWNEEGKAAFEAFLERKEGIGGVK
jgi:hypothetical protein